MTDEDIAGYFYEKELNRVREDSSSDIFEVDEVYENGKGRRKKYLVSWREYPSKFNSWIKRVIYMKVARNEGPILYLAT